MVDVITPCASAYQFSVFEYQGPTACATLEEQSRNNRRTLEASEKINSPSNDNDQMEVCTISAKGESDYFSNTQINVEEESKQESSSINDMLKKYQEKYKKQK